jgi:hypothetical protein
MRIWLEVYHFRINGKPEKTAQLQQKQATDRAAYEQGGDCQKFPRQHLRPRMTGKNNKAHCCGLCQYSGLLLTGY